MGRKKTKAADIKRRLREDDEIISPFASIKLVEKKEPEKKKVVKPIPKKPSEIVQGYNPSSSFADILYAYEHTGNPYTLPSKARKAEIASSKTDFGAILDKWEGKTPAKAKKSSKPLQSAKSTYKPTKSFGDILASFEGVKPQEKEVPKKKVAVEIPDDKPLFRKENEDEKVSPEASWSIFGGRNENFVRKEEVKEEPPKEEKKEIKRVSKPYNPTKSFAEILSTYEEPRKKVTPEPAVKKAEGKTEEKILSADNLFKAESDDEKRSPEAVWSVFGGNKVPEERREEKPFAEIFSDYEKKSVKTFDEILKEKGDGEEQKPQYTITKLRTMPPQATLDLHGYTASEAEEHIKTFLDECNKSHLRKISIITGKGLHSEDGVGVLRDVAIKVLEESGIVREKSSAPLSAGGAGALWIILKG